MKYLSLKTPFLLVAVVIWSLFKLTGICTALNCVCGMVVVVCVLVTIALEFYKSGDIGLRAFGLDTVCSIAQLILFTVVATVLITKQSFSVVTIPDGLMCAAVLFDAWFSPFNSFRTALRNFSGAVNPSN